MRKMKGVMSVLLAGLFLPVTAVFGICAETARVSSVRVIAADLGDLACENILACYQRELFTDYQLFFMNSSLLGGTDGVTEKINAYLEEGLNPSVQGMPDYIGAAAVAKDMAFTGGILEDGGAAFLKQVSAYMKYREVGFAAEMLVEKLGVLDRIEREGNALRRIMKLKSDAEERLAKLYQKKNVIERRLPRLAERYARLAELREELEGMTDAADLSAFRRGLRNVIRSFDSAQTALADSCTTYREEQTICLEAFGNYRQQLASEQEELEPGTYEALDGSAEEVQESLDEVDGTDVTAMQDGLQKNIELTEQLKVMCNDETTTREDLMAVLGAFSTDWVPTEEVPAVEGELPEAYRRSAAGFFDGVAIAGVIPPDHPVSQQVAPKEDGRVLLQEAPDMGVMDRLFLVSYARDHFQNFMEEEPGDPSDQEVLQYELEYLVSGHAEDATNLARVTERILALRVTIRFAWILTQEEKVAAAKATAAAFLTVPGMAPFASALEYAILMGEAAEYGKEDTAAIMQGEQVEVYPQTPGMKMGYEDYLMAFLGAVSGKNLTERCLQLIEWNLRTRYRDSFRLEVLFSGISGKVDVVINERFYRIRFIREMLSRSENGWWYQFPLERQYRSG